MHLKIVNDEEEQGMSEDGLIKVLQGQSWEPNPKPTPCIDLALMAMDFWIEEWEKRGVEISAAELHTNYDPEDDVWYFTVELTCDNRDEVDDFLKKEDEIITAMVNSDLAEDWYMDYTVITKRKKDAEEDNA